VATRNRRKASISLMRAGVDFLYDDASVWNASATPSEADDDP